MMRSGVAAGRAAAGCGLGLALAGLLGCGSKPAGPPELPPPMVTVAAPVERPVTQYVLATGRTEPLEQVEIRARVNGYLKALHFKPGAEVEKGQLLLEIDPEPYKADLARARANQATAEADLATARADLGRAETRVSTTKRDYAREEEAFAKGAGSAAARDNAKGASEEAEAARRSAAAKIQVAQAKIEEAKAAVQTAELNLGYCTITSPISGVVGDRLVTEGNLVAGGQGTTTLLTTVVANVKMDVAFDVDERTLQRIQEAIRAGKIKEPTPGAVPAETGLALHGTDYPLKGQINFEDNRVDPKTGTIRVKARFDNPRPAAGPRLLTAGMYARVRIPIGEPVRSVLVPEAALGSDQGIQFLYLLGPENKAVRVDVAPGGRDGDLRVIESVEVPGSGKPRPLRPDDRVIVGGVQRVRPGMTVDPKPARK